MSHDDGIGKLWSEIGRRNVGRVALVYAGAAWGLVHMSTVMAEALEIPHWVNRFLVFLLVAFAPIVIGFSWVYELTPEGLKRSTEAEKDASLTHRTAQRLNVVIIALIVLLAGLYGADRFLLPHEGAESHAFSEGSPTAAVGGISIAVLPFLNLSSDKEQEFFSDGMTEEITSALAKVKGLRVVGRTSAFEFKGQNKDLRAIGQALGAANLLEGSVRKAGTHVRITGQLIRASDGSHIWTEDYDRELTDIFKTQDDIAQAIAGALRVPLGLQSGKALVSNRTNDTETYQQYLRAKALVRRRDFGVANPMTAPVSLLEEAVARDPNYAPAWALLSQAYSLTTQDDRAFRQGTADELRRVLDANLSKADAAARRAMDLAPHDGDAYTALGLVRSTSGRWQEGEDLFKHALELDPLNPETLHHYSTFLGIVGRVKDSVAMREQLQSLEPFVPIFNVNAVRILLADGQTERALAIAKALPANNGGRAIELARIYASQGHYEEAADALLAAPTEVFAPGALVAATGLLRTAPAPPPAQHAPFLTDLDFVYNYVGAPSRALDFVMRNAEAGYGGAHPNLWSADYRAARQTERFKTYARKAGLVDYWRARGWPDVCHPVGKDDFACD